MVPNSRESSFARGEGFFKFKSDEASALWFASLGKHDTHTFRDNPRCTEENYGLDVLMRSLTGLNRMKNKASLNLSTMGEATECAPILFEMAEDGVIRL